MNEQSKALMVKVFNEWAKRYAENPEQFGAILDENGQPIQDYGEMATRVFEIIAQELEQEEILTLARSVPLQGAPANPMDKEYLSRAASLVQALLPDNHVFFLLVAPVGDDPDNRLSYTSSMRHEDALNVMREFLIKCGAKDEWLKHF